MHRPVVHKARPDADAHFQFTDEATPAADRIKPIIGKGRMHNKGLGLYEDHVMGTTSDNEDDNAQTGASSVVNNEHRAKDFGKSWDMQDDSPAGAKTNGAAKIGEDRKRVLQSLDAHWEMNDISPEPSSRREDSMDRPIKLGGNGMGGRKGTEARWALADESPEPTSKKENVATERGIKLGGNGMGGRKGANNAWITGGDEEEETHKPVSKRAPAAKNFWDF